MEISWIFKEIADLLEFKEGDFYKIRAYRRAAKVLTGLTAPVEKMYKDGTLNDVPGIGKNILSKIGEILETGDCKLLRELKAEIPPGVLKIITIPGVGYKKARVFYEQLNIKSVEELEQAARNKQIRTLPGMGAKREQEIINNIKMLRTNSNNFLLSVAMELAEEFVSLFKNQSYVCKVEVTGSARRCCETVRDLDILLATDSPQEVYSLLERHPMITGNPSRGERKLKFVTTWGIKLEIITVLPENFYPALLMTTGSKGHWNALKDIAAEKDFVLTSEALYDKQGNFLSVSSEKEIYNKLDLSYIPPEMRENTGELELACYGKLPQLISTDQIKGDLHIHSNWSDGGNSIEELVAKARKMGYSYIAITDHSRSLKVAGGLSIEDLNRQHEYISILNREIEDIKILRGAEVDILSDGTLDYPDEMLEELDVVIASVHTAFKQERSKMTQRIISAIKNPHVNIVGHLTGRLLGSREGYGVDVEEIVRAAAYYNTALEINSSPDRLDLSDKNSHLAAEHGVKLAIGTDAHDLKRMEEISYGISVARRAWLTPDYVLNTMDTGKLMEFLGREYE